LSTYEPNGRPPVLGEPGFEGFARRRQLEGHLTGQERDARVALHRALRRVEQARENGQPASDELRAELAAALALAQEAR
jgi:hypothetical protein